MTICIAALAENGKKIVYAADQMITANVPISYEFETDDVKKIHPFLTKTVVMTAGNALVAHEILSNARQIIDANSEKYDSVEEIANIIRDQYAAYRLGYVINKYLEPRGLSLQNYYDMQQRLVLGVVQEIENALVNEQIGVELIIAGHNSKEEGHIFTITHPGMITSHDAIGYVCVGSGAPHAMYHIIGSDYKRSMNKDNVEKLVLEAKKKSENAPGVGTETTIGILPIKEEKNAAK